MLASTDTTFESTYDAKYGDSPSMVQIHVVSDGGFVEGDRVLRASPRYGRQLAIVKEYTQRVYTALFGRDLDTQAPVTTGQIIEATYWFEKAKTTAKQLTILLFNPAVRHIAAAKRMLTSQMQHA